MHIFHGKPIPGPSEPCWFMRRLMNGLIDNRISWLGRWYARLHIARCPQCKKAYEALLAMRDRLLALGRKPDENASPLSEQSWEKIESAWEEIEKKRAKPPD